MANRVSRLSLFLLGLLRKTISVSDCVFIMSSPNVLLLNRPPQAVSRHPCRHNAE